MKKISKTFNNRRHLTAWDVAAWRGRLWNKVNDFVRAHTRPANEWCGDYPRTPLPEEYKETLNSLIARASTGSDIGTVLLYEMGISESLAVCSGGTLYFTSEGRPFYFGSKGRRVYVKPDSPARYFKDDCFGKVSDYGFTVPKKYIYEDLGLPIPAEVKKQPF